MGAGKGGARRVNAASSQAEPGRGQDARWFTATVMLDGVFDGEQEFEDAADSELIDMVEDLVGPDVDVLSAERDGWMAVRFYGVIDVSEAVTEENIIQVIQEVIGPKGATVVSADSWYADLVATVDGLVAQLERDPNIAIAEKSVLRNLWRPRRDRRRPEPS